MTMIFGKEIVHVQQSRELSETLVYFVCCFVGRRNNCALELLVDCGGVLWELWEFQISK